LKIKQEIVEDPLQTNSEKKNKRVRKRKNVEANQELQPSAKRSKANKISQKTNELSDTQNVSTSTNVTSNNPEEKKRVKRSYKRKTKETLSDQVEPNHQSRKRTKGRKVEVKREPLEQEDIVVRHPQEEGTTGGKNNSFRGRKKSTTKGNEKKLKILLTKLGSMSKCSNSINTISPNSEEMRSAAKCKTVVYEESFNEFKLNLVTENNIVSSCQNTIEEKSSKPRGRRSKSRNSLKPDQGPGPEQSNRPPKLDKLVISIKNNKIVNGQSKVSNSKKKRTNNRNVNGHNLEADRVPENTKEKSPIEGSEKSFVHSPAVSSGSGLNDSREGELVLLDEEDSHASFESSSSISRRINDLQKLQLRKEKSLEMLLSQQTKGQDKKKHHWKEGEEVTIKNNNLISSETISEPIKDLKTLNDNVEHSNDENDSESEENFEQIFDEIVDHMAH
jgi:hypothetical protein